MTSSEPKKQSPRERLRALYAAKFPDSPVPSRAGCFRVLLNRLERYLQFLRPVL